MREKEDEDEVVADWKFAAMVIDRFVVFDSVKVKLCSNGHRQVLVFDSGKVKL
jgi:hypothetical protein